MTRIRAHACAQADANSLDFESGTLARAGIPRSYGYAAASHLETLSAALGMGERAEEFLELQDFLFAPWADGEVPREPPFASAIGDDHSPFEYSVAFARNEIELRILFEAQAPVPSLRANLSAALDVNRRLAEAFNCDLTQFDAIRDLFIREEPQPPFSLWHAVCLSKSHAPEFKIYLNPGAWGDDHRVAVTTEAMSRLGFGDAARSLFETARWRSGNKDEVRYFSIDLARASGVRVKVYFAHRDVTTSELEHQFARVPSHRAGDVERFCRAIVGGTGPFTRKPVTSCFSFVSGVQTPAAVTLHVPVAHYGRNDADTTRRVVDFLNSQSLPGDVYVRALQAFSHRHSGPAPANGLHSYASFRREAGGLRVTTYLSPQLFAHAPRLESARP